MSRRTKCKVCRKPLEFNMRKEVPREAYLSDPFCSSLCARKFYGAELPSLKTGGSGYSSRTRT